MRVIAGKCRSLQLKTPKGLNTRPTQDRIKETLFNMIQNDVSGSVFLDLYSGSGGIGIEALSRGAKKSYFFDNSKEAISCIEENLRFTKLDKDAVVLKGELLSNLHLVKEDHADIIFIDPPYQAGYENSLFDTFLKLRYINEDTLIILESDISKDFSFDGFMIVKEKIYKTNKHTFFRRKNG